MSTHCWGGASSHHDVKFVIIKIFIFYNVGKKLKLKFYCSLLLVFYTNLSEYCIIHLQSIQKNKINFFNIYRRERKILKGGVKQKRLGTSALVHFFSNYNIEVIYLNIIQLKS